MPSKFLQSLATVVMLVAALVVATEHRAQTTNAPVAVIDYQAADYTAGSTTWDNRAANPDGTGDGTLAGNGVTKTSSGEDALQFAGTSGDDRVTGTIGSTSSVSSVSIEMWIKLKDDGSTQHIYGSMLFSWAGSPYYNIYHYRHGIGFNTISSEIYGIDATSFVNQWKHIVFVMVKGGTAAQQKIYVNGVQQTTSCNPVGNLTSSCDSSTVNAKRQFNANGDFLLMDNDFPTGNWNAIADVGMVRIYKTELSASEINTEFTESISNGYPDVAPPAVSSVSEPASPSTSRNLSYNYTFSESISGLSASDFSNTGTATGCTFTPAASSGVTIRVDVSCTSDGTVIANLLQNSVTDAATNTGPAAVHTAAIVTIAVPAPTTTIAATTTLPAATTTTTTAPSATTTLPAATTTTIAAAPSAPLRQTNTTTVNSSFVPTNSVAGQLTPTEQNKKQGSTTTTVTKNVNAVTATTSSTMTTAPLVVTTTSTPLSRIDVPAVEEGSAVVQVDGRDVPVEITRSNNEVTISSETFTAEMQVIRDDGTVSSLSSNGDLKVNGGDSVKASFSGLKPGSNLEVRMYSDPVLLGRTDVTANGTVSAMYEIPSEAPFGQHSFTVLGVDSQGAEISFFTPLQVRGDGQGPSLVTVVIALPLVLAIAMAIFLPPFIRRRKIS